MSGTTTETAYQPDQPEVFDWDEYYAHVVTEDDEPVDNIFSEKQQRLLAEPLYAAWQPPAQPQQPAGQPRIFLAATNVGIYYAVKQPAIVPDFFLSLDVQPHPNWHEKRHRCYFVWVFGKPPEVVVEVVSNNEGGELSHKLATYALVGARYYVVYDPEGHLSNEPLQLYELDGGQYRRRAELTLPEAGLRLALWRGVFEGWADIWLRWCTPEGELLPLGYERAEQEAAARQQAEERAELEATARQQAEDRATRLAERLRELGLDPEQG